MRGVGTKMRAIGYFNATPNNYPLNAVTNNNNINSSASYYISFNLFDPIDASGYFLLRIPP
jgi:hypothetical protein